MYLLVVIIDALKSKQRLLGDSKCRCQSKFWRWLQVTWKYPSLLGSKLFYSHQLLHLAWNIPLIYVPSSRRDFFSSLGCMEWKFHFLSVTWWWFFLFFLLLRNTNSMHEWNKSYICTIEMSKQVKFVQIFPSLFTWWWQKDFLVTCISLLFFSIKFCSLCVETITIAKKILWLTNEKYVRISNWTLEKKNVATKSTSSFSHHDTFAHFYDFFCPMETSNGLRTLFYIPVACRMDWNKLKISLHCPSIY